MLSLGTRQGCGTQAAWRVDRQGTDARSLGRAANLCDQARPGRWLSVCGGCWGPGKGRCCWAAWPSPAAPGAVTLSDTQGLEPGGDTAGKGFTGTRGTGSKEHSRGAQRCWAWETRLPTGCLVATISPLPRGAEERAGTHILRPLAEEQLNRAADPVELYRRMLLVFQRVSEHRQECAGLDRAAEGVRKPCPRPWLHSHVV